MKDTLAQNAEAIARDWVSLFFLAMGITFSPSHYIGGLFLAMAGGSLATTLDSKSRRLGIWGTLVAAFFISHLAAIVVHYWLPDFPPQVTMAVAGYASRYIARLGLRVLQRAETRSDDIADSMLNRVIPPHVLPVPPVVPPVPPAEKEAP